ncbi:MAG: hypothetical protein K9J17_03385 [Flavobacteriales bacterium]|nr:hypothetical protein [Flavobacteriales bacterium]
MKETLKTIGLFLLCFAGLSVKADIGETYELKHKRAEIMMEIENLQLDSTGGFTAGLDRMNRIWELKEEVVVLDAKIFKSYDETIVRMTSNDLVHGSNDKLAVYVALATTIVALIMSVLLFLARTRIVQSGNAGLTEVYRELFADLLATSSSEKAFSKRLLRVNIVVVIGLVMMSVSIVAYLLTSL